MPLRHRLCQRNTKKTILNIWKLVLRTLRISLQYYSKQKSNLAFLDSRYIFLILMQEYSIIYIYLLETPLLYSIQTAILRDHSKKHFISFSSIRTRLMHRNNSRSAYAYIHRSICESRFGMCTEIFNLHLTMNARSEINNWKKRYVKQNCVYIHTTSTHKPIYTHVYFYIGV